jgi:hypothetical protein
MSAVLFPVEHVVDQIHRRGERAEHQKRNDCFEHSTRVGKTLRKHECSEDEKVLRPLPRPQRYEEIQKDGSGRT